MGNYGEGKQLTCYRSPVCDCKNQGAQHHNIIFHYNGDQYNKDWGPPLYFFTGSRHPSSFASKHMDRRQSIETLYSEAIRLNGTSRDVRLRIRATLEAASLTCLVNFVLSRGATPSTHVSCG